MDKKIGSTKKYDNDLFNIEIGTFDKKRPTKIYINAGTYITPVSTSNDYTETIAELRRDCNNLFKHRFQDDTTFTNKFLLSLEVADERIKYGKKSYLSIQLHLKFKEGQIKDDTTFKQILPFTELCCNEFIDVMNDKIKEYDFTCSKKK